MKNRFDLENEIMDCWKVTDDINMVTRHFIDSPQWEGMSGELADALMNKYFAIAQLYELKFMNLFETFGECIPELKDSIEKNVVDQPQAERRLNDVTPSEWNSLR